MAKKTIETIVKKQLKNYRTEGIILWSLAGIGVISTLVGIGVYFYSFAIFQVQMPYDFTKTLGIVFSLVGVLAIVFALDKLALRKDTYKMAKWIEKHKSAQGE